MVRGFFRLTKPSMQLIYQAGADGFQGLDILSVFTVSCGNYNIDHSQ